MIAGTLVNRGRYDAAESYLDRSLALGRSMDNPPTLVTALVNSGYGALAAGDLDRAGTLLDEALAVSRELDNPPATAGVLVLLAWRASMAAEPERLQAFLREALELLRRGGRHRYRAEVLSETAVALEDAAPASAARLLGAADAGYAAHGIRRGVPATTRYSELRARLAARLGDDAFAEALDQGAGLTLDEAIVEALAALDDTTLVGAASGPA
jgi:tetratricopeptide (TPR) repeat protein